VGVDKRASKIVPAGRSSAQSGNERRMSINQAGCEYPRTSCRRQLPAIVTYKFHHSGWRRGRHPARAGRNLPAALDRGHLPLPGRDWRADRHADYLAGDH
jgi:hypothetical protein